MADIDLILFDCDGVLIDSEIVAVTIEADLLRAAGCALSATEISERFSGMHWGDMLSALERETGLSLHAPLHDKVEAILDARLAQEAQPTAGVGAMLAQITQPKCVCSNTKMDRLQAMLARTGLARFFGENVFSAKDLGPGRAKPKPDIYLHGLARMGGVPAARAVVIEDSVHGVQAARSAGIAVIGYIGGGHTFANHAANLRAAGACRIVADMADLPATLADLSR